MKYICAVGVGGIALECARHHEGLAALVVIGCALAIVYELLRPKKASLQQLNDDPRISQMQVVAGPMRAAWNRMGSRDVGAEEKLWMAQLGTLPPAIVDDQDSAEAAAAGTQLLQITVTRVL